MPLEFALAQATHLEDVLDWLEREQAESSEGFYCNKDIIVSAFEAGEMYCALAGSSVVGFVIHTLKTTGASIDILEIHPAHRGTGFGRQLAEHAIDRLSKQGAAFLTVRCAPRSSQGFWEKFGFVLIEDRRSRPFDPPLLKLTRNPAR